MLTLGGSDEAIVAFAIAGGVLVALVAIIGGYVHNTAVARHREQSRREIAAYVAEGTISPDDATRLMAAGENGVLNRS
ncbi:MAG: hypothetical protein JNM07_12455 [Phycisphaerae bacterium]|nr:hypothetical protein [Phycisphaerae bacterium]